MTAVGDLPVAVDRAAQIEPQIKKLKPLQKQALWHKLSVYMPEEAG